MNELIKNLEFISYRIVENDAYGLLGLATFRAYGKFLMVYKHLKTKDGTGTFFCSANYSLIDNGEKKYVSSISLDSRGDDSMFHDWIREKANECIAAKSARVQPIGVTSHHGVINLNIKKEASVFDQLPF